VKLNVLAEKTIKISYYLMYCTFIMAFLLKKELVYIVVKSYAERQLKIAEKTQMFALKRGKWLKPVI
jgi:hypothetical protein